MSHAKATATCEDFFSTLKNESFSTVYERHTREYFPLTGKTEIFKPRAVKNTPTKTVKLGPSHYREKPDDHLRFLDGDRELQLTEIRISELVRDLKDHENLIRDYVDSNIQENLKVEQSSRLRLYDRLFSLSQSFSSRVRQWYRDTKRGLTEADHNMLEWQDQTAFDYDIFGVTKPFSSAQQIGSNDVLASIRLTYSTKRWNDFFLKRKTSTQLPFLYRATFRLGEYLIPRGWRNGMSEEVQAFLSGKKVAEITRYGKPDPLVSKNTNDLMLLRLFNRAKEKNVDIVVASVDLITFRLFTHRYLFSELSAIPGAAIEREGRTTISSEYLIYIDLHGQAFHRLMEELKASAAQLDFKD